MFDLHLVEYANVEPPDTESMDMKGQRANCNNKELRKWG